MKSITTLLIAIIAFCAVSCDALRTASKVNVVSQGSPYELIVVCNQPEWEGELGDTLRSIFTAPIPHLSQVEPLFDVLRVTNQGYTRMVLRHRNIFKVVIAEGISEPEIVVEYDVNAEPQIIMTLQGDSERVVTEYLSSNRAEVLHALEMAERNRSKEYAQKFSLKQLDKVIADKFGVDMRVPQGYTLRADSEDFLWLSYEYPTASEGFFIYSYPAQGNASLKSEALLEARNKYASRIPGPSDGSFMTTFMDVAPDYRLFRLEGRVWAEQRGFWEVDGDFMGGPYVSYSTIDTQSDRVFTIDCYVYSPKLPKRNFLHRLEHLIYNVKFEK
ncbi:MAG: DUF4837 family protein [Rikenellaceae bacterium]